MFTARATSRARIENATTLCTPIESFAHLEYGMASVGEKAMKLVSET